MINLLTCIFTVVTTIIPIQKFKDFISRKRQWSMKNKVCKNCIYGTRRWELTGIPPEYKYSSSITCKKNSNTTEHKPYDWCGDFMPIKIKFKRKKKEKK